MKRAVGATSKFDNRLYSSVEVTCNVVKYVFKCLCLCFRSETISTIHWDIDALHSSTLQTVYEHNDPLASQPHDRRWALGGWQHIHNG
jgi:hypothetical protein